MSTGQAAKVSRQRLVLVPPAGDVAAPLPFHVEESNIRVPVLRSGLISKTAIVNRLRANTAFSFVVVTAPAGYGKTTLLAQWAERDQRPFAWVSLDAHNTDPIPLLQHVAGALHATDPLDAHVLSALTRPADSIWAAIVPRLGEAIRESREPTVIVLDNAHLLRSRESLEAVDALASHLPNGAVLVLAGRIAPRLPLAEMRAGGQLLEIGVEDLALTAKEAHALLRSAGATPTPDEEFELTRECEGWPGALHLAARAPESFADVDRRLEEFFRLECSSRLTPATRRFLRRTAVVDEMCGALCDAMLSTEGSAHELRALQGTGLFVVPLDRQEVWYRYHRLFRKVLLRELLEHEPELVPKLHRRAADWYEQRSDLNAAMKHADAAGDSRRVARLLAVMALPMYHSGRAQIVEDWLGRFDDPTLLERYQRVALRGAWIHALRGRRADAQRWLDAGETKRLRRQPSVRVASVESWQAAIRACSCERGAGQMIADAEEALTRAPRDAEARPPALLALGVGYALLGETARADEILGQAVVEAGRLGAFDTQALALSQRALVASRRNDCADADTLASEARELTERNGLSAYVTAALTFALSARTALRHGRWCDARGDLERARDLERSAGDLFPWLALQTKIALARISVALREPETALSLIAEVDGLLSANSHLGILSAEANSLRTDVEAMTTGENATSPLTAAELRLLPYLATHLSFPEIGAALNVSRHTVKTQAISVYRKLGVTSRSEAVESAVRVGLVPGP